MLEMHAQLYSFLQMAPQLHLAMRVTCHLTAVVIISVQQRGPIAILLFRFKSYAPLAQPYQFLTTWAGLCSTCPDPHFYECRD